jgi:hypothetical protein
MNEFNRHALRHIDCRVSIGKKTPTAFPNQTDPNTIWKEDTKEGKKTPTAFPNRTDPNTAVITHNHSNCLPVWQ